MVRDPVRAEYCAHARDEEPLGREDDRRGERRVRDQSGPEHPARLAHPPRSGQAVGAVGEDEPRCRTSSRRAG